MATDTVPSTSSRAAGILLHPTSLPSPYGVGDLGPSAYAWIDQLVRARQAWWQILPLGPTGFGDSPYQSFSAFAGNPTLISPDLLREDGLIDDGDLSGAVFPAERFDSGPAINFKNRILARAWENFQGGRAPSLRLDFDRFIDEQRGWLDDFALFMTIMERQAKSWQAWPSELRRREPEALARVRRELAPQIGLQQFRQFLFFRQWQRLRAYAHSRGIKIIGDIPIFVAADCADVWSAPQYFLLDQENRPTVVAGVPPDYFSATGQLWGNPLYDWQAMAQDRFSWWVARFRATFALVDMVRLDHFRGFDAYWEVPVGRPDAVVGKWIKAPGAELLRVLRHEFPDLPIIAEDLGLITPEVEVLRDQFELPGMLVLHFAFDGDPHNKFLPHMYPRRAVVYTGTHDNDTTRGWYEAADDRLRDQVRRYLGRDGSDITWDLIRLAWSSVADWAIVPLQDVLNLPSAARMNFPGKASGNWSWRFLPHQLRDEHLGRLAELTENYGRTPPKPRPSA